MKDLKAGPHRHCIQRHSYESYESAMMMNRKNACRSDSGNDPMFRNFFFSQSSSWASERRRADQRRTPGYKPKKAPQPPPKMASNDIIVLSNSTLDRSVRALGAPSSLDPLFTRLVLGLPILMGVVGASVAQNAGCLEQPGKRCQFYNGKPGKGPKGWAIRLFEHINATFPHAGHRLYNAALDATPVSLFSDCLFSHLPSEVHLVVAEWGSMGLHNYKHLPSIERVVRILLRLPSQPMIVHLSSPEWCTQRRTPRAFYSTGDRLMGHVSNFIYPDTPWARVELETTRVCHHYEQACVSMKEALEPHVLNGDTGFSVHGL